jgi:DNA polymerase
MAPDDTRSPAAGAQALAALLGWYEFCGVDLAVDEAPHDRFAESAAVRAQREAAPAPDPVQSAPGQRPQPRAPVFPEEAARSAQAAADAATDLDDLRARFEAFEGCGYKAMARHFLLSAGTPGARVMALDFAPSDEEERDGPPFVGQRADLLDNMLKAIGLSRESAYLAHFTPWRPAGESEPPAHETAALLPFVRRHIELARPEILIVLGEQLARNVCGASGPSAQLYRKLSPCVFGSLELRAATLPNLKSVLAAPTMKRAAWAGLRLVAQALR